MKRELRQTADGSSTLFVPELQEHYHSINGAIQESNHIFLGCGLQAIEKATVSILEIGFGTGLNAWLTALDVDSSQKRVSYTSLEKYPLTREEIALLNYPQLADTPFSAELFQRIHNAAWGENIDLTPLFTLKKIESDVQAFVSTQTYDIIYFDAFAPAVQPELWTEEIFRKMYNALNQGGILVTYCAQGQVKRNMKAAGFRIERLPGPPGKREITRARKDC
jgi:tRNA U34 5-methylaminomethyl-2-thiouridine-forming methyltransferase MnmC